MAIHLDTNRVFLIQSFDRKQFKIREIVPSMNQMKPAAILLLNLTFFIALTACAPHTPPAPPPSTLESSLAEASYDVSRSISSLSETAQAAHPLPVTAYTPSPASYGMSGQTSVDWSGPVEPLAREIAHATGYRLRILGSAPAIPVMVSVYDKNRMIADILRDVAYQCGKRATIVVYPDTRVIELRYAKN